MLEGLNEVNISQWKTDPNVSVKIGQEIEKASWLKSPFEPFVGVVMIGGKNIYCQ
ncbi:Uncharacterised protein [Helicobacter cinaedi]|uniref:Uncharacterized protein n=1 Tax=Helicobacter cinaedi TaxID=213 RepID=A0A377JX16_9HELI|nr:Uncharacterised protein [Helicobacter cinaedi]